MLKLAILDIDDTLTLTERIWFHIENKIAESMGFPVMDRETHRKNWGTPLREAITERIPGIAADAFIEEIKRITPELVANGETDIISEQNLETLDMIKTSGKRLAVLTSREFFEMEHFLKPSHPLAKTIESFFYRDNSLYLKPDPRVFDKILDHFDVRPEEAVYVGDTINDALCTKKAGLHFIAMLEGGLKTREDFDGLSVDYFADSFPDILRYIDSN